MPSSARIEGSATPIIDTSMPSRKIDPHSTARTAISRRLMRLDGNDVDAAVMCALPFGYFSCVTASCVTMGGNGEGTSKSPTHCRDTVGDHDPFQWDTREDCEVRQI